MNSDWLITPLVLAIAAGIVFLADRTRAIVFHTSVARDGIRVRLFGKIPVMHIPLDQIQEVERQSWFIYLWKVLSKDRHMRARVGGFASRW